MKRFGASPSIALVSTSTSSLVSNVFGTRSYSRDIDGRRRSDYKYDGDEANTGRRGSTSRSSRDNRGSSNQHRRNDSRRSNDRRRDDRFDSSRGGPRENDRSKANTSSPPSADAADLDDATAAALELLSMTDPNAFPKGPTVAPKAERSSTTKSEDKKWSRAEVEPVAGEGKEKNPSTSKEHSSDKKDLADTTAINNDNNKAAKKKPPFKKPPARPIISVSHANVGGYTLPIIGFKTNNASAQKAAADPQGEHNSDAASSSVAAEEIDEDLLFFDNIGNGGAASVDDDNTTALRASATSAGPAALAALEKAIETLIQHDATNIEATNSKAVASHVKSSSTAAAAAETATTATSSTAAVVPTTNAAGDGDVSVVVRAMAAQLPPAAVLQKSLSDAIGVLFYENKVGGVDPTAKTSDNTVGQITSSPAVVSQLTKRAEVSADQLAIAIEKVLQKKSSANTMKSSDKETKTSSSSAAATALVAADEQKTALSSMMEANHANPFVRRSTATAAALSLPTDVMAEILPANIHSIIHSGRTAEAIGASLVRAARDATAVMQTLLVEGPLFTEAMQRRLLPLFQTVQEQLVGTEADGPEAEVDDDEAGGGDEGEDSVVANSDADDADEVLDPATFDNKSSGRRLPSHKANGSSASTTLSAVFEGAAIPPTDPRFALAKWHTTHIGALLQSAHTLLSHRQHAELPRGALSKEGLAWAGEADRAIIEAMKKMDTAKPRPQHATSDNGETSATTNTPQFMTLEEAQLKANPLLLTTEYDPMDTSPAATAHRSRRKALMRAAEDRSKFLDEKIRLLDSEFLADIAALVELSKLASMPCATAEEVARRDALVKEIFFPPHRQKQNNTKSKSAAVAADEHSSSSSIQPTPVPRLLVEHPNAVDALIKAYLPLYAHLRQELVVRAEPIRREYNRLSYQIFAESRVRKLTGLQRGRGEMIDDATAPRSFAIGSRQHNASGSVAPLQIQSSTDTKKGSDEAKDGETAKADDHEDDAAGNLEGDEESTMTSATAANDVEDALMMVNTASGEMVGKTKDTNPKLVFVKQIADIVTASHVNAANSDGEADAPEAQHGPASSAIMAVLLNVTDNAPSSFVASTSAPSAARDPNSNVLSLLRATLSSAVTFKQRTAAREVQNVAHSTLMLGTALSAIQYVASTRRSHVLATDIVEHDGDKNKNEKWSAPSSSPARHPKAKRELSPSDLKAVEATRLVTAPTEVFVPTRYRTAFPMAAVAPMLTLVDSLRIVGVSVDLLRTIVAKQAEAAAEVAATAELSSSSSIDIPALEKGINRSISQTSIADAYSRLLNRATDLVTSIDDHRSVLNHLYTHAKLFAKNGMSAFAKTTGAEASASGAIEPRVIHRWLMQHIKSYEDFNHSKQITGVISRSAGGNQHAESDRGEPSAFLSVLTPEEAKRLAIVIGASVATVVAQRNRQAGRGFSEVANERAASSFAMLNTSHKRVLSIITPLITRQVLSEAASLVAIAESAQAEFEYNAEMEERQAALMEAEAREKAARDGGVAEEGGEDDSAAVDEADTDDDGYEDLDESESGEDLNRWREKTAKEIRSAPMPALPPPPQITTAEFSTLDEIRLLFETLRFINTPASGALSSGVTSLAMAWLSARSSNDTVALAQMAHLATSSFNERAAAAIAATDSSSATPSSNSLTVISPLDVGTSATATIMRPLRPVELRSLFQRLADPQWLESPLLHTLRDASANNAVSTEERLLLEGLNGMAGDVPKLTSVNGGGGSNKTIADSIFDISLSISRRLIRRMTLQCHKDRFLVNVSKLTYLKYQCRLEAFNAMQSAIVAKQKEGGGNGRVSVQGLIRELNISVFPKDHRAAHRLLAHHRDGKLFWADSDAAWLLSAVSQQQGDKQQLLHDRIRFLAFKTRTSETRLRKQEARLRSQGVKLAAHIRNLMGLYLDGLVVGQRRYIEARARTLRSGGGAASSSSSGGVESLVGNTADPTENPSPTAAPQSLLMSASDAHQIHLEWNRRQIRLARFIGFVLFKPKYRAPKVRTVRRGHIKSTTHRFDHAANAVFSLFGDDAQKQRIKQMYERDEATRNRRDVIRDFTPFSVSELAAFLLTSLRFSRTPTEEEGRQALEVRIARYLLQNTEFTTMKIAAIAVRALERTQGPTPFPLPVTSDYLSARKISTDVPPLLPPALTLARAAFGCTRNVQLIEDERHLAIEAGKVASAQYRQLSASNGQNNTPAPLPLPPSSERKEGSFVTVTDSAMLTTPRSPSDVATGTSAPSSVPTIRTEFDTPIPVTHANARLMAAEIKPITMLTGEASRASALKPVHELLWQMYEDANPHEVPHDAPYRRTEPRLPSPAAVLSALSMCDPKASAVAARTVEESIAKLGTRVAATEGHIRKLEHAQTDKNNSGSSMEDAEAKLSHLRSDLAAAKKAITLLENVTLPQLPATIPLRVQTWLVQELARCAVTSYAQPELLAKVLRNVVANFDISTLDPVVMNDVFHSLTPHKRNLQTSSALLLLESMAILESRAEKYVSFKKAAAFEKLHGDANSKHNKSRSHILSKMDRDEIEEARALSVDIYRYPLVKEELVAVVRRSVTRNADNATVAAIPADVASAATLTLGGDSMFLDNDDGSIPESMRASPLVLQALGGSGGSDTSLLGADDPSKLTIRTVRRIIPVMRSAHQLSPKLFARLSRFITGSVCVSNPALAVVMQSVNANSHNNTSEGEGGDVASGGIDPLVAEDLINRMPPMVLATHTFVTDADMFTRRFKANGKGRTIIMPQHYNRHRNNMSAASSQQPTAATTSITSTLPTKNERDAALFMDYFEIRRDIKDHRILRVIPRAPFAEEAAVGTREKTSSDSTALATYSPSSSSSSSQQQTLYDVLTAFCAMASEYTSTSGTTSTSNGDDASNSFENRLKAAARAESRYRGSTFESILWPTIRSHVLGEASVTVAPMPELDAQRSTHEIDEEGNFVPRAPAERKPIQLPKHPITLSLREITALFTAFSYIDISDTPVMAALIRRLQRMYKAAVEVNKREIEESERFNKSHQTHPSSSSSSDADPSFSFVEQKRLVPHRALLSWVSSLDAPTAVAVLGGLLDGASDTTFVRLLAPTLVSRLSTLAYEAEEASHTIAEKNRIKSLREKRQYQVKFMHSRDEKERQHTRSFGITDADLAFRPYTPSPVPPIIELLYPADTLHIMPTLITLMRHYGKIFGEIKTTSDSEASHTSSVDADIEETKEVSDVEISKNAARRNHSNKALAPLIEEALVSQSLSSQRVARILTQLHDLYEGCRRALFIMFGSLKIAPVERIALASSSSAGGDKKSSDANSAGTTSNAAVESVSSAADPDEDLPLPSVPTSYYVRLLVRLLHSDLKDGEVADVCLRMITRTGHILQQLKRSDFRDVMHAALVFRGSLEDNVIVPTTTSGGGDEGEKKVRSNNNKNSTSTLLNDEHSIAVAKQKRRSLFKPLVDHLWHHGNRSGLTVKDKALLLRWMHAKFGFVDDEIVLQLGMDCSSAVHKMNVPIAVAKEVPSSELSTQPPPGQASSSSHSGKATKPSAKTEGTLAPPRSEHSSSVGRSAAVAAAAVRAEGAGAGDAVPQVSTDVNSQISADSFFFMAGEGDANGEADGSSGVITDAASAALDMEEAAQKPLAESINDGSSSGVNPPASTPDKNDATDAAGDASKKDSAADLWEDLLMLEEDE